MTVTKDEHKEKYILRFNSFVPILNSNMTITVRIAQMEYWLISVPDEPEPFQKMSKETRDNVSPILIAKITFLGSDFPISHTFLENSCTPLHIFLNFSLNALKNLDLFNPSSS